MAEQSTSTPDAGDVLTAAALAGDAGAQQQLAANMLAAAATLAPRGGRHAQVALAIELGDFRLSAYACRVGTPIAAAATRALHAAITATLTSPLSPVEAAA